MTAPTTLYQWLRAEPGRRLPLASVHLDDARQAAREARSDGWRLWVEGGPDGYVEAICEIECARRQRERGARPPRFFERESARLREQGPMPLAKCGPRPRATTT